MPAHSLSDTEYCVLDLLMRARERGIHKLSRMEILSSRSLPQDTAVRLTFAALTMPAELVTWTGHHDFAITDAGVAVYNLRFDRATPSPVADVVICLPGPEHYRS